MSEYSVNSYFLEKETLQGIIGSHDEDLVEMVLSGRVDMIDRFSGRFSGKELGDAIAEVVNGNIEQGFPFHYSFAIWILIDFTVEYRPKDPYIGYPFIDLYDFVELLEQEKNYPLLKSLLEGLNGMNALYELPISMDEWAEMPTIAYLDVVSQELLVEVVGMKQDIEEEADWTFEYDDDLDDLMDILSWLKEAHEKQKGICLVMEGDL